MIDLILSLILITVESATIFILFFCLTYINCLVNNYNNAKGNKNENVGDENKCKNRYYYKLNNNFENTQNDEDNTIIKIDNIDISEDKENQNKEEEQFDKIDEKKSLKS